MMILIDFSTVVLVLFYYCGDDGGGVNSKIRRTITIEIIRIRRSIYWLQYNKYTMLSVLQQYVSTIIQLHGREYKMKMKYYTEIRTDQEGCFKYSTELSLQHGASSSRCRKVLLDARKRQKKKKKLHTAIYILQCYLFNIVESLLVGRFSCGRLDATIFSGPLNFKPRLRL